MTKMPLSVEIPEKRERSKMSKRGIGKSVGPLEQTSAFFHTKKC